MCPLSFFIFIYVLDHIQDDFYIIKADVYKILKKKYTMFSFLYYTFLG